MKSILSHLTLAAESSWKCLQIHLAWCNSNKRVTLPFKRHGSRSVWVMRCGCYANGFQLDSHLANCTFSFFFTFFQVYVLPLRDVLGKG